ncbi:MAG: InlB B-repeat-containing protein [Spirochaetaceae bacterium]|nr:InlB B-repeat-containing protein [Spirochaetaceae bacterium]
MISGKYHRSIVMLVAGFVLCTTISSCNLFIPPTYSVLYDANGATSGSVPIDSVEYRKGDTVTVQGNTGNLARTGYGFSGWNTNADGTGTAYQAGDTFAMGSADVTLYAQWSHSVSAIAAGMYHTMVLCTDGSLWGTGWNFHGQLGDGTWDDCRTPKYIASDIKAVAAGYAHTMVLRSDDTLWGTGDNSCGELGDGTTTERHTFVQVMNNVKAVAAGSSHTMILKNDGTLWATGYNYYGQLGDGTWENRFTPVRIW